MAMKKKPGRSKVEVGIPSTEAVFSAGNNNASNSARRFFSSSYAAA